MVKPRRTPHGQSAAERAAISNTANGLSVAQGFCWINLKGHIEKKCALSYLKVLSIGSSSRAQSWRFLEKFALPLSGRLLHDSVHQNSTVMIRKKKHVQTASGWYDIFRYNMAAVSFAFPRSLVLDHPSIAVAPLWYHGANSDASSVSTCVPCTCMDNAMIWRCYGSKFPGGHEWKFGCWDDLVDDIWVRDLKTGWLWRDIWHRCIMMYHCSLALLYPFMFLFYPFLIDIVPL